MLSEALRGFIRGLRGFISGTLRFRQRLRGHLREQLTQLLDGLRRPARARSVHASVCKGAAVTCDGGAPGRVSLVHTKRLGVPQAQVHAGALTAWLYMWATASVLSSSISRSVVPGGAIRVSPARAVPGGDAPSVPIKGGGSH